MGLQKWKFSTGKKHFTPGNKSGKMTLPPQKKFPVSPLDWICVRESIFDNQISLKMPIFGGNGK